MREAELLNALAKGKGGVQVNMSKSGATVSTRYSPLVCARSETLFDATKDVARQIIEVCEKNPALKKRCRGVFDALEAYDRHSDMLAL